MLMLYGVLYGRLYGGLYVDAVVTLVESYAKSVALASDTVSRVWVDMTSRVVGVNP